MPVQPAHRLNTAREEILTALYAQKIDVPDLVGATVGRNSPDQRCLSDATVPKNDGILTTLDAASQSALERGPGTVRLLLDNLAKAKGVQLPGIVSHGR